jgi:hypothetical protein
MIFVIGLWTFLRALFVEPAAVALENLALRHQLLVLQRSVTRLSRHELCSSRCDGREKKHESQLSQDFQ